MGVGTLVIVLNTTMLLVSAIVTSIQSCIVMKHVTVKKDAE